MSQIRTDWIWMNGRVTGWDDGSVHVSSHALHYGSGVFEGIRCYETDDGPAVFRLDAHLDRFYASAESYSMPIPYTRQQLEDAICDVIQRNGFSSCYVRPIAFYGADRLGVHPKDCPVEVAILAWPWGSYLGDAGLESGVRITVSPWVKFSHRMMPTTAKACGQYVNSILAVRDAVRRGYDEALLLDEDGYVAEGSGENLFVVKDSTLATNDGDSSILLGITRDAVTRIAGDLGFNVSVRKLRLDDLLGCEEAFFTGTAAEVTPIREVDGTTIGCGRRGPVAKAIQDVFFAATSGRDPRYSDWLYFVARRPVVAG